MSDEQRPTVSETIKISSASPQSEDHASSVINLRVSEDKEKGGKFERYVPPLITIFAGVAVITGATITGHLNVDAASETGRNNLEAARYSASTNLIIAESERKRAAYADFVAAQNYYLDSVLSIVKTLRMASEEHSEARRDIRIRELVENYGRYVGHRDELVRHHQVVRLLDSEDLDGWRVILQGNEHEINGLIDELGPVEEFAALDLTMTNELIKNLDRDLLQHGTDLATFTDKASREIKLS